MGPTAASSPGDDGLADPTGRFSDRVADYVRARPRYPDALVDLLGGAVGLTSDSVLADVGAGTGLSAEPFLRRGHRVVCIEPNAAMRAAAEALLGGYDGFRSLDGTAEATGLAEASVDCVLVAQAFHWFDVAATRRELRRILRPPRPVCLAWNTRRTADTPFLRGYEALLRRFGTDYEQVRRRTESLAAGDGEGGARLDAFFTAGWERRVLENEQALDLEGLKSRLRSASYVPAPGQPRHAPMMAELERLFEAEAEDGRVRIPYDLEVYWGWLE